MKLMSNRGKEGKKRKRKLSAHFNFRAIVYSTLRVFIIVHSETIHDDDFNDMCACNENISLLSELTMQRKVGGSPSPSLVSNPRSHPYSSQQVQP